MTGGRTFRGLVLIGFMGSGKTSAGREISRRMGAEFLDLDDRIEHHAGMRVREIFATRGEAAFREMEREAIREAVSVAGRVIATGGGAFQNEENRRLLKRYAPVVFLEVTPGEVASRLSEDRTRPLLPGRGIMEEREIVNMMDTRRPAYEQADLTVRTDGCTVSQVADQVLERIGCGPAPNSVLQGPEGEGTPG